MGSDYNLLQPENILTSVFSETLVVRAGVLTGAQTFTFRLYASLHDPMKSVEYVPFLGFPNCSACSWAQVTLKGNAGPSGGHFHVQPKTGTALSTNFLLAAQTWVDQPIPQEDYPLTYTFGYKDERDTLKYLVVDSLSSSYEADLPIGSKCALGSSANMSRFSDCNHLELVLEVADALHARAVTNSSVRVVPPPDSRIQIMFDHKRQIIASLLQNYDGRGAVAGVASGADFLNDRTVPFTKVKLDRVWKSAARNDLVKSLKSAVDGTLQPILTNGIRSSRRAQRHSDAVSSIPCGCK